MEVSALILVNGKFLLLKDGNKYSLPNVSVPEMEFPFDEFKAEIKKLAGIDVGVYGEMGKQVYLCKAVSVPESKSHLWISKEDFLSFKYVDNSELRNIVAGAML